MSYRSTLTEFSEQAKTIRETRACPREADDWSKAVVNIVQGAWSRICRIDMIDQQSKLDSRDCGVANKQESPLRLALKQLESEICEGLRHGFFDLSISCEVVKGGKRRLLIRGGKNHQFVVRREEL